MESQHRRHCSPLRSIIGVALLASVLGAATSGCSNSTKPDGAKKLQPNSQLEFQILATEKDDEAAIEAARKWFAEAAKDAARTAELQKLAEQGLPPTVPNLDDGPRYAWVEIAPSALRTLHERPGLPGVRVDPAIEKVMAEMAEREWDVVSEARKAGVPVRLKDDWIWSRDCQNTKLTKEAREQKQHDYFFLVRLAEPDVAVTGEHLSELTINRKTGALLFSVGKAGEDRMQAFTSKNKGRTMAVVVDGQIIFKASIHSPIRRNGQILGNFTDQELDRLAELFADEAPKK